MEGRIQTRQWEDEKKLRHWKTEIVAGSVEMLSGRRKKDYAAESAAEALEAQAGQLGIQPHDAASDDDDDNAEATEAFDDEPVSAAA